MRAVVDPASRGQLLYQPHSPWTAAGRRARCRARPRLPRLRFPTNAGLTVICEERSDTQDLAIWREVAKQLSASLNCPALAVLNHDDDIFCYALYRQGTLLDEYNSCPDYWDDIETPAPPRGGDARALCESLGMPGNLPEVERILRASAEPDDEPAAGDEFLFACDRHAALVKALNWPKIPYLQGFGYLTRKSPPDGWRVVP